MGLGDFWLQLNNGKKYSLKAMKDIKPEDVAKNPKLQKFIKLFDLDGNGTINGQNEWESIFTDLQQAAQDHVLSNEEFGLYISQKMPDEDLTPEDLSELLDAGLAEVEEVEDVANNNLDFINLTQIPEESGQEFIAKKDDSGNTILWNRNEEGTWNATVFYPNGSVKCKYIVYKKGETPNAGKEFSQEDVGIIFDTIPEVVVTPEGVKSDDAHFIAQAQYSPYAQLDIAINAGNMLYSKAENTLNMIEDFKTREDFFTWLGEKLINLDPTGEKLTIDDVKATLEKFLSKGGIAYELADEARMLAKTPDTAWLEVFKHRYEEITGKNFSFYNHNKFQITSKKFETFKTYEYFESLYQQGAQEVLNLKGSKDKDKYSSEEIAEYIKEGILPEDSYKNPNLKKSPRAVTLHYLIKVMGSKMAAEELLNMCGLIDDYGNESDAVKNYAGFLNRFAHDYEEKKKDALNGESPENIEARYKEGLKELYGYDDKESEVMKLMEFSQEAGGTLELALDMVLMALGGEAIMAINAGKYAASTSRIVELLTKVYGSHRSAAAMRFLTTLTNVGIDVSVHAASLGFNDDTLENNMANLGERAKNSADYMFYGAYVAGPAFEKLTKLFASAGAGEIGFLRATLNKTPKGIVSKSVTATQFMKNVMSIQPNEADFISKIGHAMFDIFAYGGHDAIMHGETLGEAFEGQLKFQAGMGMFSNFMHMAVSSRITQAVKVNQMRSAINSKRLQNIEVREETRPDGQKQYYCIDKNTGKFLFETRDPNTITNYLMVEVSKQIAIEQAKQAAEDNSWIEEIMNTKVDMKYSQDFRTEENNKVNDNTKTKTEVPKPTQEISDEPDVEGSNKENTTGAKTQEISDKLDVAINNAKTFEFTVKELSDSEFSELKKVVEKKIEKLPKEARDLLGNYVKELTKANIQIVDKIISSKNPYNQIELFSQSLYGLNNINQAKMFEFVFENFSDIVQTTIGYTSTRIITDTTTPEQLNLRISIMKTAVENQMLGNSSHLTNIILDSKSVEQAMQAYQYTETYGVMPDKKVENQQRYGKEVFDRMMEDFAKAKEEFGLNVDNLSFGNYRKLTGKLDEQQAENFEFDGNYIVAKSQGANKERLTFYFDSKTGELLSFKDDNNIVYNLQDKTIIRTHEVKSYEDTENLGPSHKLLGAVDEKTDFNGNWLGSVEFVKSKIDGVFEVYEYDINGKRYKTGLAEFDKNGGKHIERRTESLDGTVTEQVYADDKQGNNYKFYKITDSNGQILYESAATFKVIDKNHFVSTEDGQSYDIVYTSDNVVVTKLDEAGNKTDEQVIYKIKDYTSSDYKRIEEIEQSILTDSAKREIIESGEKTLADFMFEAGAYEPFTIDRKLLPALRQLSGTEWFSYKTVGTKTIIVQKGAKDNAHSAGGAIAVGKYHTNDASYVEHESGHEKFNFMEYESDENFLKLYNEERAQCQKFLSETELDQLDYFFEKRSNPLSESGAEENLVTKMPNSSKDFDSRSMFLQKYMPKTIAYVANMNRLALIFDSAQIDKIRPFMAKNPEVVNKIIKDNINKMPKDRIVEKIASFGINENRKGTDGKYEIPDMRGKTVVSSELDPNVERRVRIEMLNEAEHIESELGKQIDAEIFNVDKSDANAVNEIRQKIQTLSKTNPAEASNLELLLNILTSGKKCSEVTRDEIAVVTQHLRRQYALEESDIAAHIQKLAGGTLGEFSGRVKSDMSTFDKIANYAKDHPDDSFMKAIDDVRDADGNRFTLDVVDISPEKVQELINKYGEDEAAKIIMKEASKSVEEFIRKIIGEQGAFFDIERISNYRDAANLSIIDEGVMFNLQEMAKDNGFVVIRNNKGTFQNRQQRSAYPAFQINLRTKTGKVIEIQIRFQPVHEYAESEHFVYDVMTGKDIIGRNTKLEPLLNPFIKALKEGMTQEEYDNFYINYTRAQYRHRFLKALGIETNEPELQDFTPPGKKFDERLRAKNLFLLHDLVEGVKKGKISPEKAVEEYNKAISSKPAEAPETSKPKETTGVKAEVKPVKNETKTPEQPVKTDTKIMTTEEAFSSIRKKLYSASNLSEMMPFLNVLKDNTGLDYKFNENGIISFFDKSSKTGYSFEFDGQGNVIKFYKTTRKPDYQNEQEFYIYDKNGKSKRVSQDEYYKVQPREYTNELRNYIITNPELLPEETRKLLLQDKYHFYTKEDIDELASLLKTPEDIAIANKLLSTKGNENTYIRTIGNMTNLSQHRFGPRDIVKVLKSEDARKMVLEKTAQKSYVKKTELEPLLNDETFDVYKQHKFTDEADISYRTQDINIDNVSDIVTEYQTNLKVREQINKQVPNGEAACINGRMYCRAENNLIPINLDKATFDRLFPVEERYNISQGDIGNCYFISELSGYAASPNGRAALYSSFRQEGNDIIVTFPQFENIEIKFKNGELNKLLFRSIYKFRGKWTIGTSNSQVNACDGIKMIEQAYAFVRNIDTDFEGQIVANDKFLMNKQMHEMDNDRLDSGIGTVTSLFQNAEILECYTSHGTILRRGVRTVEEGLDVLSKELKTNVNAFGSVNFSEDVNLDNGKKLVVNHLYRITGYDKNKKIVKIVNPHDSSMYMDVSLDAFKAAKPSFAVFKIGIPDFVTSKRKR